MQAPYLCEEGGTSKEGVTGGGGWLEVVVRGTVDAEEGELHWGLLQERGTAGGGHMAEREWWGGAGAGRCDDGSEDAVCGGDNWGEWAYGERTAKKWGGTLRAIPRSPAPKVVTRGWGGRRGGRRDWIRATGARGKMGHGQVHQGEERNGRGRRRCEKGVKRKGRVSEGEKPRGGGGASRKRVRRV